MDDPIATSSEMTPYGDAALLDDETVDRLLDGRIGDRAPSGYEWVADVLDALRAPGEVDRDDEALARALFRAARADDIAVISCIASSIADTREFPDASAAAGDVTTEGIAVGDIAVVGADEGSVAGRPSAARVARLHRRAADGERARRAGFVAAVAAGLTLVTATSVAATGALPAPAQRAAHAVMAAVGVHVPTPPKPIEPGLQSTPGGPATGGEHSPPANPHASVTSGGPTHPSHPSTPVPGNVAAKGGHGHQPPGQTGAWPGNAGNAPGHIGKGQGNANSGGGSWPGNPTGGPGGTPPAGGFPGGSQGGGSQGGNSQGSQGGNSQGTSRGQGHIR